MVKKKTAKGRPKKKERKNIAHAKVHIKSTFNNIVITVTDLDGNAVVWESAGGIGFKGSRKSTPFAAQRAAESVARKAKDQGVQRVDVFIKGTGSGRETAVRTIQAAGIEVIGVTDVTPVPHNGCRPKKRRRV